MLRLFCLLTLIASLGACASTSTNSGGDDSAGKAVDRSSSKNSDNTAASVDKTGTDKSAAVIRSPARPTLSRSAVILMMQR